MVSYAEYAMANQRKKGKRLYGFWVTDEEHALLQEAARKCGFENVSDYIKWVAIERPPAGYKPRSNPGSGGVGDL